MEVGDVFCDGLFVYGLHSVHIRFNLETFPFLSRKTKCCDCSLSFLRPESFQPRSADLRRSAWQRGSADYNKNRGIDSQIEGTFFTAVAAAFTAERHSDGQGVNGQNP